MWTALRRRLAPIPVARVGRLPDAAPFRPAAVSGNLVRRPAVGVVRCPPFAPAGTSDLTVTVPPAEVRAWDVAGPLLRDVLKLLRAAVPHTPEPPRPKPEPFEAVSRHFVETLGFTPSPRRLPADWFPPGIASGVKSAELYATRDHVPLVRIRTAPDRYTRWDAERVVRAALSHFPTAVVLLGNATGTRAAVASAACIRAEWGHVLRRVPPRAEMGRVRWLGDYGAPRPAGGQRPRVRPGWRPGLPLAASTLFSRAWTGTATMSPADTVEALASLVAGSRRGGVADLVARRNALLLGHLRLSLKVIHRYRFLSRRGCFEWEDLVHESVFGLVRAIERFDPSHGATFSTYAFLWVRQAIQRAVENNARLIRIPAYRHHPKSPLTTDDWRQVTRFVPLPSDRRGEGEPAADEQATGGPETAADELRGVLDAGLRVLTARERDVIVRRFDLDGRGVRSLRELGDDLGVSRERVRQIQVRALKRLKGVAELREAAGDL